MRVSSVAVLMLAVGCGPKYDTEFIAKKVEPEKELTYHIRDHQTRITLPGFRVIICLKRFERHGNTEGDLTWYGEEDDAICLDIESVRVRVTGRDKEGNRRRFTVHVTRRLGLESQQERTPSKCADLLLFNYDLIPPPKYPRLDPDVLDVWYSLRHSDGSIENKHFRLHLRPQKAKAIMPFAV